MTDFEDEMLEDEIPEEVLDQALDELQSLNGQGMECAFTHPIAFAILSAIQLACMHPKFTGAQRDFSVEFAHRLESWLGGPERPAVMQVMKKGWGRPPDRRMLN